MGIVSRMIEKLSRIRHPSGSSISSGDTYSRERWYESHQAKRDLLSSSSAFYALVLSIFALIFEMAHLMNSKEHKDKDRNRDAIFGFYMYGLSLIFMFWCYYELYQEHRHKPAKEKIQTMFRLEDLKEQPKVMMQVEEAYKMKGELHEILTTGSLFLRLGAIFFAIMGIIFYAFQIYFCFGDRKESCEKLTVALPVLGILFMIFQTHFIFCNWKIGETHSKRTARFGTMHMVATNLWTWFRFVFKEEHEMSQHVSHALAQLNVTEGGHGGAHGGHGGYESLETGNETESVVQKVVESIQGLMFTSIVEYSLIGAAVMYIVWYNIKHEKDRKHAQGPSHFIRINFRNICVGVFLGVIFLILSIASMILYHFLSAQKDNEDYIFWATMSFSITDGVQFIIGILTCLYVLFVTRVLSYEDIPESEKDEEEESQELLDMILLTVGMTGEIIYSGTSLFGISHFLRESGDWNLMSGLILVVLIFRTLEVLLQSVVIFICRKLRVEEENEILNHPGKQGITFLLIINISMFIMNLFEAEKVGVSPQFLQFYGESTWIVLVRSFTPLTIFYRFHSSVMLTEIWRNVYAEHIQAEDIHKPSVYRQKKKIKKIRNDRIQTESPGTFRRISENGGGHVEMPNGDSRHRNVVNINIRD